MTKEFCRDCWGWENEKCRNKFSPYFTKQVGEFHTCQQIQTDTQNTDFHPSVKRENVFDTGLRYEDDDVLDEVSDWELLGLDPDTPQEEIDKAWEDQMG